ncbi:flagellar hook-basal body complex protein FliE [Paenibacillus sabuli]|nr:flagellar hook-basal body complex protein FliE [Paenibacillus sabuli]
MQPGTAEVKQTPSELTGQFGQYLKQAIDGVHNQEQAVHEVNDRFLIGQADVSEVMITANQAHLTLQLATQVRNKVIESYQEIMRMQL